MNNELKFSTTKNSSYPYHFDVLFVPKGMEEDKWEEMADWCLDQFGQPVMSMLDSRIGTPHQPVWMQTLTGFAFQNEKDAFSFKMRWG